MPKLISTCVSLDAIEQVTIKAALIYWRDLEDRPAELEYLAGNCGEFTLLDLQQIDQLICKVAGD